MNKRRETGGFADSILGGEIVKSRNLLAVFSREAG